MNKNSWKAYPPVLVYVIIKDFWNSIMTIEGSALRNLDPRVAHMVFLILAFMWSGIFSIMIGSITAFGISAIAHIALVSGTAITVMVFNEADKRPESLNKTAKNLKHEYVTIEHLLFSIMCSETLYNLLKGFGADVEYIKTNLEHHLKNSCKDIEIDDPKHKPKKTQSVERVLNRAFTQTLFSGRSHIDLQDVVLSVLSEKKSVANYYLEKGGVQKDKLNDYLSNEMEYDLAEDEMSGQAQRALRAFTTNLNQEVQKNKIDPVIGRSEELDSIALALGRRNKNNVLLVGDPGVGKTAIAEGLAWNIVNDTVPEFLKEYNVGRI